MFITFYRHAFVHHTCTEVVDPYIMISSLISLNNSLRKLSKQFYIATVLITPSLPIVYSQFYLIVLPISIKSGKSILS